MMHRTQCKTVTGAAGARCEFYSILVQYKVTLIGLLYEEKINI